MSVARVAPRVVFAVNDAIMVLYGISAVMIGTTLPEIIEGLDLSLGQGGTVVSMQNAGGIVALLAAALVADRIAKGRWVIGFFLLLGGLLFATGFAGSYIALVWLFFASGAAIRLLDIMLNAYTGDVAAGNRSRVMNLLHMFFSIGAFIGPLLASALLSAEVPWRGIYRIVGASFIGAVALGSPLLRAYGLNRSATRTDGSDDAASSGSLLRLDLFALGLVLLLYGIHQSGVTAWLPYYLIHDAGFSETAAGAGLSAYWVGVIASRLLASRLAGTVGPDRILVTGGVAGGVAVLASILTDTVAGFVVAAVLTGATIPIAMTLAYGRLPARTGTVTAALSIFMLVGRLVGPWIIGAVGDVVGIGSSILVVAFSLLMAGVVGIGGLRKDVEVDAP